MHTKLTSKNQTSPPVSSENRQIKENLKIPDEFSRHQAKSNKNLPTFKLPNDKTKHPTSLK